MNTRPFVLTQNELKNSTNIHIKNTVKDNFIIKTKGAHQSILPVEFNRNLHLNHTALLEEEKESSEIKDIDLVKNKLRSDLFFTRVKGKNPILNSDQKYEALFKEKLNSDAFFETLDKAINQSQLRTETGAIDTGNKEGEENIYKEEFFTAQPSKKQCWAINLRPTGVVKSETDKPYWTINILPTGGVELETDISDIVIISPNNNPQHKEKKEEIIQGSMHISSKCIYTLQGGDFVLDRIETTNQALRDILMGEINLEEVEKKYPNNFTRPSGSLEEKSPRLTTAPVASVTAQPASTAAALNALEKKDQPVSAASLKPRSPIREIYNADEKGATAYIGIPNTKTGSKWYNAVEWVLTGFGALTTIKNGIKLVTEALPTYLEEGASDFSAFCQRTSLEYGWLRYLLLNGVAGLSSLAGLGFSAWRFVGERVTSPITSMKKAYEYAGGGWKGVALAAGSLLVSTAAVGVAAFFLAPLIAAPLAAVVVLKSVVAVVKAVALAISSKIAIASVVAALIYSAAALLKLTFKSLLSRSDTPSPGPGGKKIPASDEPAPTPRHRLSNSAQLNKTFKSTSPSSAADSSNTPTHTITISSNNNSHSPPSAVVAASAPLPTPVPTSSSNTPAPTFRS